MLPATRMKIAAATKKQFLWLTCANKSSSEVCEAAFARNTDEQLKTGYRCDPTSKSNLKIIAKKVKLIHGASHHMNWKKTGRVKRVRL